jgi:kynurenine formamidase
MLRQQYEQWRKDFKTWGKWAPVGQESKGTTSLITPEKVQNAMKLVKSGIVVSLAHAEPQQVAADVGANGLFKRTTLGITEGGTTDNYQVSFHGQTVAHIDSWCHFFENGQMYNGVAVQGNLSPETGCVKGGIMNWKDGITTRAVLYDIAQLKGVDVVDPAMPIRRADLEAWEKKAGVKIGSGDAVLLRTGRWARREKLGPWNVGQSAAGLHASVAPWIKARGVAFLGSDAAEDVTPSMVEGIALPIHTLMITGLGMNLLDNQDLEALGDTAARLNRWEFMLTIAPVPVTGGTGFPLNAIAMF